MLLWEFVRSIWEGAGPLFFFLAMLWVLVSLMLIGSEGMTKREHERMLSGGYGCWLVVAWGVLLVIKLAMGG